MENSAITVEISSTALENLSLQGRKNKINPCQSILGGPFAQNRPIRAFFLQE